MKGANHTESIEKRSTEPHKSIKNWDNQSFTWVDASTIILISANGTGMKTKNLYAANKANVNSIFCLTHGWVKIDFTVAVRHIMVYGANINIH